jgi:TfoX/Sxy family transcriptional regulator of competence genes
MAYDEKLNDRIREAMAHVPRVVENARLWGTRFILNGKMCAGVVKDEMMCRIDPDIYEEALEKRGCREMVFTGSPMKGYVFVSDEGIRTKKEFEYWISLCLALYKKAKAAKKKKA